VKKKEMAVPVPLPELEVNRKKEGEPREVPKGPVQVDWSKKSCEAPTWNVGDRWVYKTPARPWTREIVAIKDGLVMAKVSYDELLRAYDGKTGNLKFLLDKSGRRMSVSDDSFKKYFDFPFFVGKKWSYTTSWGGHGGTSLNRINEFKVETVEEVVTPAGEFQAFRIFCKQTILSGTRVDAKDGWTRYWYSAEAKMVVKQEYEKSRYWPSSSSDYELYSYKLKP